MSEHLTRTALGPHDPDDGDQGRQQRGLAIAILAQEHIRPDKFGYKVPSQSGNGVYWSIWSTAPTAPARTSRSGTRPASTAG